MSQYSPRQSSESDRTAFNKLPIELNKAIVHHLSTDRDITTYRLICKATNDAIDADRGSFWRARFRETYDMDPAASSNKELRRTYQRRSKVLRRTVGWDFFRGWKTREVAAVGVLRGLVVDAFQGVEQGDGFSEMRSKNQQVLAEYIRTSKFLVNDRRSPRPSDKEKNEVSPLLAAVKLMCVPLLFELEGIKHHVFGVEELQRAVYAPTNAAPLYRGPAGTTLNLAWVLQCLEFFRHHMTNQEVATLVDAMDELPPDQRPTAWREPLRTGAYKLGRHWKGTYSYLSPNETRKIRSLGADDVTESYFTDMNVDEGRIQSLELDFVDKGGALPWPPVFEAHLRSLRGAKPKTLPLNTQGRSQAQEGGSPDNLQFYGVGTDGGDEFQATGWVNGLPAQEGIPGWQRITFMKHFGQDEAEWDKENLWAYEGVVLPGGRIILGRWWFANAEGVDYDSDYNGPFILWAVAAEGLEVEGGVGDGDGDGW